METEIQTVANIIKREQDSDRSESLSRIDNPSSATGTTTPSNLLSAKRTLGHVDDYLRQQTRERGWNEKEIARRRGHINEFCKICGNKPVNTYRDHDGARFKEIQLALPRRRSKSPFHTLGLVACAKKADALERAGRPVQRLTPPTVRDKIQNVKDLFEWIKSTGDSAVNPLQNQTVKRGKHQSSRTSWSTEQLNLMLAAPIYSGCKSERYWKQPGDVVLKESAKFWVSLIGLFSGMRLGEIIQLHVSDIKTWQDIVYFDVTDANDNGHTISNDDKKSLKTASSKRRVPVHQTLIDIGFGAFVARAKERQQVRLFPDYKKADGSWSKTFGKFFKQFRQSFGVDQDYKDFHALRHTVEDALRNTGADKTLRDAIQGHIEDGSGARYGNGYGIEILDTTLQKIDYPGLKLDHLFEPAEANDSTDSEATTPRVVSLEASKTA